MVVQAPLTPRRVGFVAAGGLSTRMGVDKSLLSWGDTTLLDHAIARLEVVCRGVRILCGPEPRYGDRGRQLVVDEPGSNRRFGPLAGLAAALASAADADALLLGVDLPHVTVELLRTVAHAAAAGDADAVVPVTSRGPEPLCALYRPRCLPAIRARLQSGDTRMTSFWPDVRVHRLEGDRLAALGDERRLFLNVNAPADYAGAKPPAPGRRRP